MVTHLLRRAQKLPMTAPSVRACVVSSLRANSLVPEGCHVARLRSSTLRPHLPRDCIRGLPAPRSIHNHVLEAATPLESELLKANTRKQLQGIPPQWRPDVSNAICGSCSMPWSWHFSVVSKSAQPAYIVLGVEPMCCVAAHIRVDQQSPTAS